MTPRIKYAWDCPHKPARANKGYKTGICITHICPSLCFREEAEQTAAREALAPSPPRWKGKLGDRDNAEIKQFLEGGKDGTSDERRRILSEPERGPLGSKRAADDISKAQGMAGAFVHDDSPWLSSFGDNLEHSAQVRSSGGAEIPSRFLKTAAKSDTVHTDLSANVPSEEEWIPERGPRPPTELHSIPSASYRHGDAGTRRGQGHMCGASRIELVVLAISAAGPGYAERCDLDFALVVSY